MTLELRCPHHPFYDGHDKPQFGTCTDCHELYRLVHEEGPWIGGTGAPKRAV